MSRIDEALKRATGRSDPKRADAPVDPAAAEAALNVATVDSLLPAAEAFTTPWTFDAEPGRGAGGGNGNGTPADRQHVAGLGSSPGETLQSVRGPAVVPGSPGALFHGFDPAVVERLVVGDHDSNKAVMSVAVEQYRRLAAALHHSQIERGIKAVMITSAVASEGKTLTATNLALTLAESYRRRVLLIDADLRRPALHEVFQVPNVTGLRDALQDDAQVTLALLRVTPHLMLVPSGRPDADPMGLLTSDRMRRIVDEARARYDWVIVDAPPVGLLTDANLLAKIVDATLLVVEAAETGYPIVRRAADAIGRDRILGVVLNKVDLPDGSYGYKYDKYYAAYYAPKK